MRLRLRNKPKYRQLQKHSGAMCHCVLTEVGGGVESTIANLGRRSEAFYERMD